MSRRRQQSGSEIDRARRERYTALMRRLCDLPMGDGRRTADVDGCPFPAQLRRLKDGDPVVVSGWEVELRHPDVNRQFTMDADGRLTEVKDG